MGVICGFEGFGELGENETSRGQMNIGHCLVAQLQMFAYGICSVDVILMGRYTHDFETSTGGTRIANTVYTTQAVSHVCQYRVHP